LLTGSGFIVVIMNTSWLAPGDRLSLAREVGHEKNAFHFSARCPADIAWGAASGVGKGAYRQDHNLRRRAHESDRGYGPENS
jgi:hypothetical protein